LKSLLTHIASSFFQIAFDQVQQSGVGDNDPTIIEPERLDL
jgi:hypothetical protein